MRDTEGWGRNTEFLHTVDAGFYVDVLDQVRRFTKA